MTTYLRIEHRHLDVACDLDVAGMKSRAGEWQAMRDHSGMDAASIPGGARLWLRADAIAVAKDIVGREAQCCGFLDVEIASEGDRICIDITSVAPEGAQVARVLAGLDPLPF